MRLAAIQKANITLLRLELLAVTIGVRTANFVTKELKVTPLEQIL